MHFRGNDRTREDRHHPWRSWASKVHRSKRPQPGLQSRRQHDWGGHRRPAGLALGYAAVFCWRQGSRPSLSSPCWRSRLVTSNHLARGEALATDQPRIKPLRVLLRCRPLLAVAAAVMLFHLGKRRDAAALWVGSGGQKRQPVHHRGRHRRHRPGRDGPRLAGSHEKSPKSVATGRPS